MCRMILQYNKRILALCMAAVLFLCLVPMSVSAETYSGSCGDNLSWTLTDDTLVITGSGAMADYPESVMSPWYPYREQITTVVFPDGLTRVGDLSFYGCKNLTTVILPDSVAEIGWHAFDGCTSIAMLELGSVRTIGDAAFRECVSLQSVRLPGTLNRIGYQAFSRCESLTDITVPASVTELGEAVFAFCYRLVRAEIKAEITQLPTWTFYGCGNLAEIYLPPTMESARELAFYDCDSLTTLHYTGSESNAQQLQSDIERDQSMDESVTVTDQPLDDYISNETVEETDSGYVVDGTAGAKTENADISVDSTTVLDSSGETVEKEVQMDVTLENADGWVEIQQYLAGEATGADNVQIDLYLKSDETVSEDILAALADMNAEVTVHTASGAVWKLETPAMEQADESCGFTYTRAVATAAQLQALNCSVAYQLTFDRDAQINAKVMIRLPMDHARQVATLYQMEDGAPVLLQSVLVDDNGFACFYLASVKAGTEYLIGINVPGVDISTAIIPESLQDDFGITYTSDIEYVITGTTSSWGLTIGQVTWIMIGGLALCVVAIGGVMFALNKRKLKKGYVPQDIEA